METLECEDVLTDSRGAGGGKGLVPVLTGGQGLPRVKQQSPSQLHPVISSGDILYKNLEAKLVTFRKIFIVSTYLPSHTSLTDVSTFSTTKYPKISSSNHPHCGTNV